MMRRHRASPSREVEINNLKFLLTNGFKVRIIYFHKKIILIDKSNREQEKINDLAVTPDSTEEGERINNPLITYQVRRHVKNCRMLVRY